METPYGIPSLSAIEPHEGSNFRVPTVGKTVELRLVEVDTGDDTIDDHERFSMLFRGPADGRLEQAKYRLEHPELGAFDALVVPVVSDHSTPDPERVAYQVVVDRHIPGRVALSGVHDTSRRGFLGRATLLVLGGSILGSVLGSRPASAATPAGEALIGSIGMFAGNFAPRGYALCDGRLLDINQNSALFSILGTTYGGDGRTTFALPDLRGRVPIQAGQGPGLGNVPLGAKGGVEAVTLTTAELPAHGHDVSLDDGSFSLPVTSDVGDSTSPDGNVLATQAPAVGRQPVSPVYSTTANPDGSMVVEGAPGNGTVGETGGGQAHTNMQPYLGINYIIALQGLFPSRN